jgi:hypothetical protein
MVRARVGAPADSGGKMKNFSKNSCMTLVISAIGLALVHMAPAEAAKSGKHKKSVATARTVMHSQTAEAVPAAGRGYQGGVLRGPLYNGQDYIGDDPDPNVRAFLIKNLSGRYGSSY